MGFRLVGVVVLVAVAAAVAVAVSTWGSSLPSGVAMRVEGQDVTFEELDRRAVVFETVYGVRPPPDATAHDEFRRDVAASLALTTILEQAAEERGISPAQPAIDEAMETLIAQRYPNEGRSSFVRALANGGVSEAEVRREVERQLTNQVLFLDVTRDEGQDITSEQVRAAYEELTAEQRILPELRDIRHLVVATRSDADEARERLDAGDPFGDVARDVSLDRSTREAGGRLGALRQEELDAEFGEAAFSVEERGRFGPVATDLGWHVGQVDEVRPSGEATFDDLAEALEERLVLESVTRRWQAWLAARFESTEVRYAEDVRPADPARLPGGGTQTPGRELTPGHATDGEVDS